MNLYNVYTEAELVKAERDKLPDSSFGLPKTRQYPLHDAEHVRKAIQMFGNCPKGNRKELAGNIFTAAKKFDVEISEKALVYKYLTSTQQKEVSERNSKHKKMAENSSMLSFVEFYQFPLNEENIKKYGKDYKELSVLTIEPDIKGLILVDRYDQVAGHIRVNTKSGELKDIRVNPTYRKQGIGSKLLNTEVGKEIKTIYVDPNNTIAHSFFKANGFNDKKEVGKKLLMSRFSTLIEDTNLIDATTLNENLDNVLESLSIHLDIVTETESYLNQLKEASVAGVAAVPTLSTDTIRKPFTVDTSKLITKACPNMFDYDEFFEPEESKFVCDEANNLDVQEPIDIVTNIPDKSSNSSSDVKKPQVMMEDEAFNEDNGVIGAIIWDIIKFIVKLPFKIGKFIAKRIKASNDYKIDKAIKEYRKAYDQCLDISRLKHKEITLEELCKELKVNMSSIKEFNTNGIIKVTAWYKSNRLVSYFIEILENKNSTEYEYVMGIVDDELKRDPTKTLLCAVMEFTTNSYGKYLDKVNTILRKRGAKLLEETILVTTDVDATALKGSEIVNYADLSTDIIVGVDRYTTHKDENGCFYIKLNANEAEDQTKKALVIPFINENMWITSDFHLTHKNRNSANFANLLVSEINAKVPVDGCLMICGDLGDKGQLRKTEIANFISRLNVSKKILLLGNHDNLTIKDYYDCGFTFVTDVIETDKYIFSHCPVDPKGKINIHGHIHGEKEYWNIPAEGHIDVYIHSHDDKIYQLRNYLEFYKQGKYKGKSIKKRFD